MKIQRRRARALLAAAATGLVVATATAGAAAGTSSGKAVDPPPGAATPIAATGIGTDAALDNPRCNTGPEFGVYGRFDTALVGDGPVCVRPFEAGEKNGGATARGVTGDSIKVVVVHPSRAAAATASASTQGNPRRLNDNTVGTPEDGLHDQVWSFLPFFETWGRDIEVVNYESTGNDETAQRSDAVAILAMKPFAVIDGDAAGLDVLEAEVAKGKTLVFGYGTQPSESQAAAPYRWGAIDFQVTTLTAAQVVGRQLVGKKAAFAGSDDIKGQTRKLGVVSIEDVIDVDAFKKELAKSDGTVASEATYPATGGTFGDATVSQQLAPTIVARLKQAGVTTVVLFTDVAMNSALMANATQQNWFPEWFFTGAAAYTDVPPLAQQYDDEQTKHAFGLSALAPYVQLTPEQEAVQTNANYTWFWGRNVGTIAQRTALAVQWLLNGVHTAGPDLTVKNFQRGLFSIPARGGSSENSPLAPGLVGYGGSPGLPYDSYSGAALDFAVTWLDPTTDGRYSATGVTEGQANWFVDGGQRAAYGKVPKKPYAWFDKDESVLTLETYPAGFQPPEAAAPCPAGACPSTGAASPTPGSPGTEWVATAWPNGNPPATG